MADKEMIAEAGKEMIAEGEYAVKLTQDISGGIGNHEKGTVLRNLSFSAYNTLVCSGMGKRVKSTTSGNVVDFDEATPAPKGAATV